MPKKKPIDRYLQFLDDKIYYWSDQLGWGDEFAKAKLVCFQVAKRKYLELKD